MSGDQRDGLKPALGGARATRFHMNVRWLRALIPVEEEPIGTDAQNGRHPRTPSRDASRAPYAITPCSCPCPAGVESRPLGQCGPSPSLLMSELKPVSGAAAGWVERRQRAHLL